MRSLNQQTLFSNIPAPFTQPSSQPLPSKEDIQECKQLLRNQITWHKQLENKVQQMQKEVESNDYKNGIGYFNSKNMLMMQYLIQLHFYELFKINNVDLTEGQGLALYQRLVYLKTLLTKLGPVEKKLDYQKNKLLKQSQILHVQPEKKKDQEPSEEEESQEQEDEQAEKEESGEDDYLAYQPRPQALIKVRQEKQKEVLKEGKYVPPKMSATLSKEDRFKRKQEIKQTRRKSRLIRRFGDQLRQEDDAHEIGMGDQISQKIHHKFGQKIAMQEDLFTRFPQTRKEKAMKKKIIRDSLRKNRLQDDLQDIEMIGQIFEEKPAETITPKRKMEPKVKAGKKKRKVQ